VTPLVNGITQYYLLPDRSDRPAFTPTGQVGTRFIDPVRMKGLVGWLHTKWFTLPQTVTHPSTNRVRRSATTLIETNALPLSQTSKTKYNYNQVTTQKPEHQLLRTTNICKTKPDQLKCGSGCLLHHPDRKQIGPIAQRPGPHHQHSSHNISCQSNLKT